MYIRFVLHRRLTSLNERRNIFVSWASLIYVWILFMSVVKNCHRLFIRKLRAATCLQRKKFRVRRVNTSRSKSDLKILIFQNSVRESKIARTMKNVKRRCSNLKILITYVPFRTGFWPMLEPYSETLFAGYLYVCIHIRILHLPSKSI